MNDHTYNTQAYEACQFKIDSTDSEENETASCPAATVEATHPVSLA